ncbi:hypothetical protein DEAC_c07670 [Desulfosporosinus acididurans]|uniref:Uncharacterized protein n=1 Tax=Desulfosporosinus acididurans TaxID=476652 RepID=A0A0J1FX42_9FIRM|nr:hypothetical protein [Desulfosporosinus acididurans]KLU67553.1 hypothetical protein DEAC_c07670 [Desulfosporosinus acididurans]
MNDRPINQTLKYRYDEQTSTFTDVIIWTPSSGKTIMLYGIILSTNKGCTLTVKFGIGLSASTFLKIQLANNTNQVVTFSNPVAGLTNQVVSWSGGVAGSDITVTLIGNEV